MSKNSRSGGTRRVSGCKRRLRQLQLQLLLRSQVAADGYREVGEGGEVVQVEGRAGFLLMDSKEGRAVSLLKTLPVPTLALRSLQILVAICTINRVSLLGIRAIRSTEGVRRVTITHPVADEDVHRTGHNLAINNINNINLSPNTNEVKDTDLGSSQQTERCESMCSCSFPPLSAFYNVPTSFYFLPLWLDLYIFWRLLVFFIDVN